MSYAPPKMSRLLDTLLAPVRTGVDPSECYFYHSMEIPGVGEVEGNWDLRGGEDAYLGGVDFSGKRVLEIGPASGYLTMYMEKHGASVTAVDLPTEEPWDFAPVAGGNVDKVATNWVSVTERLHNSWWLVRERFGLDARVWYGDSTKLPEELGHFDVAVLAAVLLHCRDFLGVLQAAASRSDAVVVTDRLDVNLSSTPVAALVPTRQNNVWHTWWIIGPLLIVQFLDAMGFDSIDVTGHGQPYIEEVDGTRVRRYLPFFTVLARRTPPAH